MDHFLSVNQVASVLNLGEELLDVLVPGLEVLLGALLLLDELDNPLEAVDLGGDALVHDHVAKLGLGAFLRDTDQVARVAILMRE